MKSIVLTTTRAVNPVAGGRGCGTVKFACRVTVPAPLDADGPPVFARAGAIIPLAPDYDSLVPSTDPDVRTWTGDLIVRVMPSGPAGTPDSSFVLYDGTVLHWNGTTLRVDNNPKPRSIELRTPDGASVVRQIDGSQATISNS